MQLSLNEQINEVIKTVSDFLQNISNELDNVDAAESECLAALAEIEYLHDLICDLRQQK